MKGMCHFTSEPLLPCWAPDVISFVHNAVLLTGCPSPCVHNTLVSVTKSQPVVCETVAITF